MPYLYLYEAEFWVAVAFVIFFVVLWRVGAHRSILSALDDPSEEVAEAVLFLASERAAQITGIVMPVDGGTTAGAPPRSVKDLMARPKETG